MGNDTILYYVLEETITGCKRSAGKHLFGKIKLTSFQFEEDGISAAVIMIPSLDKGVKSKKLLKTLREETGRFADLSEALDIVIQPEAGQLIGVKEEFSPMFWKLAKKLVDNSIKGGALYRPESVVLLLGNSFFPEEQMQRFDEMMQPYFSQINNFTVVYEAEDDASMRQDASSTDADWERGQSRLEAAIDDCMDMFYYEYGLVGEICVNGDFHGKLPGMASRHGSTLYLDYGYKGRLPYKLMKAGGIYVDVLSSPQKEVQIRKKCSGISYLSARKYLDTMVKSGYDKLVNQA